MSRKLNKINRKQFYLSFISTTPDYLKEIVQHFSMGFIISSYKNLFNKIYKPTKFLTRKIMIANILVSLIGVITIAYAQYKTILLVFGGSILIGTLMSIIQSLGMIFQRVQNLLLSFGGFHNDLLYINNLREFLETQEVEGESENESSFNAVKLVAENLCYKVGDRTIIENINFEFKSNTIIGIKGSNGVGKSTLIDIIQGIKKQTSGDLFINGINSSEITEKKRLHLCQTLRQNPPRYEFTLNDNIAISDYKKLSKGNVVEHINSYDPDSFIFNKDIDIKTMLGEWYENSKQLSGGQWQLIGLFRLLYRTSPVYLLDEPTNNLDSKSIQLLKKIIAKASKKSLIIIVSHDESFLEDICTRIYNMKWNELSLVKDLEKELVTSK
ncbi:ABC transporter ATP-binding protein [Niallia sp. RD1]|uniref:ATP-binding cassette domain-containing protein n=1 Tax=Niallia sp. RD1 TaxID=2962858 RepID=UPI0020C1B4C3|nr:ABC transporter ATP-binding protein [Niallia sp. RD1]UTI43051.1 ABC transporter ATP-binding protein/permease [Niallia sp. RD1]